MTPAPPTTPTSSANPKDHTPLRLAEKHYKNRSLRALGILPSLRASPVSHAIVAVGADDHGFSSNGTEKDSSNGGGAGIGNSNAVAGPSRPSHSRSQFRAGVVDLSRPVDVEDDEVYQAGWWAGINDEVEEVVQRGDDVRRWIKMRKWRGQQDGSRAGEVEVQRELGERGPTREEEFKMVRIGERAGYLISEGCILIPQYLSPSTQFSFARASLSNYTRKPNPTSLDTHYVLPSPPETDLFTLYAKKDERLIMPVHSTLSEEERATLGLDGESGGAEAGASGVDSTTEKGRDVLAQDIVNGREGSPGYGGVKKAHSKDFVSVPNGRRTIETPAAATLGYDETVRRNKEYTEKGGRDVPSVQVKPKRAEELVKEMRWANLGWVYQWTSKSYDFTPAEPIAFPPELAKICSEVVQEVNWDEVFEGVDDKPEGYASWKEDYVPDTGIVNFYQTGDTLMAHVDRAELDPSRPLVSISLGHACIFLLGTSSRHSPPTPLILRSGDVLIMSGKGRQAYHGVPRIMEGTLPGHFSRATLGGSDVGEEDAKAIEKKNAIEIEIDEAVREWIRTARINVNVRQVFPPGFKRPEAGDARW